MDSHRTETYGRFDPATIHREFGSYNSKKLEDGSPISDLTCKTRVTSTGGTVILQRLKEFVGRMQWLKILAINLGHLCWRT
jgi:hypothetical protein